MYVIEECTKNMINHTTLALVAVLAAAALVIGAVASPAFAGGHEKRDKYDKKDKYGDSSKTITKQVVKQKQKVDDDSLGIQNANNCIIVASKALCGQQVEGFAKISTGDNVDRGNGGIHTGDAKATATANGGDASSGSSRMSTHNK